MWNEGYRDQRDGDDEPGRSSINSEVVVMDDAVAAVSSGVPTVSNLNISKSSRVHIGPKFVSVTQNVNNTEMIKGCVLGLELVAAKRARRLRCSVAVFVCWAFIVVSGLVFYLVYVALPKHKTRLDLDIYEDWYLRRIDWQALKEYETEFLQLPVKYVIIGHSAGKSCIDKYSCIQVMRSVQQQHINRGWDDIGPNFFVGGDGLVFEGRGGNVLGVMIYGWNKKMISIMFIGNYENDQPNQVQFDHLNVVLDELVKKKVLDPKYILYGHCQVITKFIPPGPNIMHNMRNFSHWDPANANECLSKSSRF